MSDKRYDSKNRWRNKSIAFRGSPEEAAELDKRWRLCGYSSKQDYLLDSVLHQQVDLMPANIELSGVETSLVGIMSSETVLKEYIEMIDDRYDYIIVDCSPNLGQLTLNALVAADEIIIPVQAAYLSIKGLEQLLKTISRVKRKMNPKLHIMGILLTMVDYRTNYANEITDVLYQVYGNSIHIFENVIPMSVRAAETPAEGISIYKHDAKGKVAQAYETLTQEVINRE